MTREVLVARLDGAGDVLVAGPAIRAVAAGGARVTVLCGPAGAEAARMLPGVDDVLVWAAPWIVTPAPPVSPGAVAAVVGVLARRGFAEAVLLTSFHQSPLPTALLLRLAAAAGYPLPLGERGGLAVQHMPAVRIGPSVVLHPGAAHLAAAVGTPVVSLFAPVVPALRWRPYGVRHVLLGDQLAPCRDTRARECPVPGHPCLAGVSPREVVDAVARLAPIESRAA